MPMVPGVPGAGLPAGDDALVRRIQALERQMREMLPAVMAAVGPAISDLQTQQAALTSQETQLSDQLASINTLIGQQVTGWTGEAAADVASYPYNGSTGVYATVNVPVPAGYSTAYITSVSSGRAQALVGTDVGLRVKAIINGNESREFLDGGTLGASVSCGHSVTVTGLSGGTIAVATRAGVSNATATTSGWVATSVTAFFIR